MTDDPKTDHERLIEHEARMGVKFSMEQAILRAGGGGLMAGGSPFSQHEHAQRQLLLFLDQHLRDDIMETALVNWVALNRHHMDQHLDTPVQGLLDLIDHTMNREARFVEFVRTVDVHYGLIMQERPHFQQSGDAPTPGDAYTFTSVRNTLLKLAEACRKELK